MPSSVAWPSDWRSFPLWSLFRRVKDVGHPDEEMLSVYRDHGVVVKDTRNDNFNKTAPDRNIYQLVDEGWLIVNRMKAWQGSLGISPYRGIVSGHYICFEPQHNQHPQFLNYLLRSTVYTAEFRRMSRGVRPSQIEIDNEALRSLQVHLPTVHEQRVIADFLDTEAARIDALITKKEKLTLQLIERRTSLAAGLLAGDVSTRVPSRIPWLPARPRHWREAQLRLLARLGTGHTPSRSRPELWVDCDIPWITTGEVKWLRDDRIEVLHDTQEHISVAGLAASAAVVHPAGTVVLSRTASPGYSAVIARPMATSQDFVTWTCEEQLEPRFLLLCLRVMRPDLLGRLAMGSTHKTIYFPDIESIRIPLPPLAEQRRIVERAWAVFGRIDAAVDRLSRQIELLREHRQALITAAVTGELAAPGFAR